MWSKKTTNSLTVLYRPLIKLLNGIAMGTVAAMMFLTATDVILRYIFNRPISGAYEVIEYMMAILIPFGLAYCALQGGHVSVDLLVSRFPKKIQSI
ncbi:MAG: TRAP transporter small permease, partial [Deltaproteobacteria bacterium]